MPRTHVLKTWPEFFDAVERGDKTFEVRRDDRAFRTGDRLRLLRYRPEDGLVSGELTVEVSYKLPGGQFGVEPGYAVLGLRPLPEP